MRKVPSISGYVAEMVVEQIVTPRNFIVNHGEQSALPPSQLCVICFIILNVLFYDFDAPNFNCCCL